MKFDREFLWTTLYEWIESGLKRSGEKSHLEDIAYLLGTTTRTLLRAKSTDLSYATLLQFRRVITEFPDYQLGTLLLDLLVQERLSREATLEPIGQRDLQKEIAVVTSILEEVVDSGPGESLVEDTWSRCEQLFDAGHVLTALSLVEKIWLECVDHYTWSPSFWKLTVLYSRILASQNRFAESGRLALQAQGWAEIGRDTIQSSFALHQFLSVKQKEVTIFSPAELDSELIKQYFDSGDRLLRLRSGTRSDKESLARPLNRGDRAVSIYASRLVSPKELDEDRRMLLVECWNRLNVSQELVSSDAVYRQANKISQLCLAAALFDPDKAVENINRFRRNSVHVWDQTSLDQAKVVALQRIGSATTRDEAISLLGVLEKRTHSLQNFAYCTRIRAARLRLQEANLS